jgi:hypothetical protein
MYSSCWLWLRQCRLERTASAAAAAAAGMKQEVLEATFDLTEQPTCTVLISKSSNSSLSPHQLLAAYSSTCTVAKPGAIRPPQHDEIQCYVVNTKVTHLVLLLIHHWVVSAGSAAAHCVPQHLVWAVQVVLQLVKKQSTSALRNEHISNRS